MDTQTQQTSPVAPTVEPAVDGITTPAPEVTDLPAAIRPYRPEHAGEVRRIWRETIALGSPIDFSYEDLASYESLSLDWYLDPANHDARRCDAVVVEEDGRVRGYLLACLDQQHFDRWCTRAGLRWGVRSALRLPLLSKHARMFVRRRIADGLHAFRHQAPAPFPAHMHFNLDPQLRGHFIGHHLVGWMDRRVAAAGLDGYFGEVNVPEGRSLRVFEDGGGRIVDRVPNRTFSWILGQHVERAVIARPLADRTDTVPR